MLNKKVINEWLEYFLLPMLLVISFIGFYIWMIVLSNNKEVKYNDQKNCKCVESNYKQYYE